MSDNEQIAHDICEMIEAGDLDASLGTIQGAALVRQRKINFGKPEQNFKVGATVKIVKKLKPNYLFGFEFEAVKVNPKTVMVDVPLEAKYRKYAGQQVRIPKTALEVV